LVFGIAGCVYPSTIRQHQISSEENLSEHVEKKKEILIQKYELADDEKQRIKDKIYADAEAGELTI